MTAQSSARTPLDSRVGQSTCMRKLHEDVRRLGDCDVNVLLQGESGTGKELISRAIHATSHRRDGPFIGVNCAAIHETLLEAELFGHEAGAFTGATSATKGVFRAAEGGTILLDEIGDMSPALQSKLLRTLEQRTITPVGSTRAVPIDVRVIAATHRDLEQAVQAGSFRLDLYYRLNVVCLQIDPLRDRAGDIPILAEHMLHQIAEALQVPVRTLSSAAMDAMLRYAWPGNVRQLGNVIQRAYVLSDGPAIELDHLPSQLRGGRSEATGGGFRPLRKAIDDHVAEAIERSNGVQSQAARLLGIDRKTLWRMARRKGVAEG